MTFKILTDAKVEAVRAEPKPAPIITKLPPYNPNGKKTFCYWTVADGKHGEMAKATVKSARNCGVTADFHIWTDLPEIEDATVHPCGNFDKKLYMFKFHFLKNEVSKLNYDYYVFFDADNFFVRDPGDLTQLMSETNRVFVQMENDCDPKRSKRGDWWSCPIDKWGPLLNDMGVRRGTVWNTNAGFWIVERGVVEEFYRLGVKFFEEGHRRGYKGFTEEPPLAYIGHILQKPEDRVFENTNWLWSSDWIGNWKDKIPTGKEWTFEDYMSGEKKTVNPCIVHAMRSKNAMISWYNGKEPETFEGGFWSGHNLLGDVIGFVAAAHLMYVKTGKRQKVWFQESRKGILDYFDGVDWVPRESIPNAIDAGRDPKREEWDNMNGVKRFYKWMDPSLTNPKTFDIHMKGERIVGQKLIGLVTHANTQGDIPDHIVDEMISEARKKYPDHKIVAIGNMDNRYVPKGVEDWRQSKGDIQWIVETIRKLDLLISPQTGPCFIAAGYKIPMWIYRSKEAFWDNVLNYDTYKVERWWDREVRDYSYFDNLYLRGGWDGNGSGNGSKPENNKEYLQLLHKIIDYTPNIKTIVDIGCGDWQLMKNFKMNKKYIGIDVSKTVIDNNIKLYASENVNFINANPLVDDIPDGDLCIIKDVLQHLPNKDVIKCLEKLNKFKYCIITNDYTPSNNVDINVGDWRPINVLLSPYNVDGITLYGYNGKHVILKGE